MEHKASKYQEVIFDFVENGEGNAVIEAVAGSGKTTTIVEAVNRVPRGKSVLFSAFNKSIVEELKKRIHRPKTHITTMHSFGYTMIKRYYAGINLGQPHPNKAWEKVKEALDWDQNVPRKMRGFYYPLLVKTLDLMRQDLRFDREGIELLWDRHNIPLLGAVRAKESERRKKLKEMGMLEESVYDQHTDEIDDVLKIFEMMLEDKLAVDFSDMVFLPALMDDMRVDRYDYIFIDEAQDLNRAQQELLKKAMHADTRFIAVGDPAQAIYGFAGADARSFKRLQELPNTISLPLSVCYRCPTAVIEQAKQMVPHIQSPSGKEEGEAKTTGKLNEIELGYWVLCRNVRPLVQLCIAYIKDGVRAKIKGEDIGKQILQLLNQLRKNRFVDAKGELNKMYENTLSELKKNGIDSPASHPRAKNLVERISVIEDLSDDGRRSVNDIKEFLKVVFDNFEIVDGKKKKVKYDPNKEISLCTIHKAKGLESDNIALICPELIPSKYAVQKWQVVQEYNLLYVAYTRAKKKLLIVKNFNENKLDDLIQPE